MPDEEAKNFIAYCGLNCAVCFSYKMTVSEAAKSLRRELRTAKLKNFWGEIPFLGEYEPFKKSLDAWRKCAAPGTAAVAAAIPGALYGNALRRKRSLVAGSAKILRPVLNLMKGL